MTQNRDEHHIQAFFLNFHLTVRSIFNFLVNPVEMSQTWKVALCFSPPALIFTSTVTSLLNTYHLFASWNMSIFYTLYMSVWIQHCTAMLVALWGCFWAQLYFKINANICMLRSEKTVLSCWNFAGIMFTMLTMGVMGLSFLFICCFLLLLWEKQSLLKWITTDEPVRRTPQTTA